MKFIFFYLIIFLAINAKAQNYVQFKTLKDSASNLMRSKNSKAALPLLNNLIAFSKSQKSDSLQMIVLDRFAFYYFVQGDYEKSVSFALDASEIAKKLNNRKMYFDLKNNIGMIFSKLDEYEKAKQIYTNILKETSKEEDAEGYLSTLSNLGSVLRSLNQIDSSSVVLNQALSISRNQNNRRREASILKFLAKNNLTLEKYEEVILIVNNIETNFWTDLQLTQKDDAIFYRAQALYYKGELKRAEKDINKTLSLMNVLKKDPAYLEVISFKSKIIEAQSRYKEALNLQNEIHKLRDSFDSANRTGKVLELEKKYQIEKKEKENAELKASATAKDLTILEKNNQILIVVLLAIVLTGSMISWQLKKFKTKNNQLNTLIDQKIRLQSELDIVRDNIAKDFHDDLGNKLARITTLSDHVLQRKQHKTKSDMLDALGIIKKDADDLYNGTRDFMFSLKSDSDNAEDIYAYLADFAQDYLSSLDVDLYLKSKIDSDIKLPYYWNRQIILIFKEAITNAVKHGKAESIKIEFLYKDNTIYIMCKDNGLGFDTDILNSKNGLRNMKQRAEKINCNLDVKSSKNGTIVSLNGKIPNFEFLKIA